MTFSGYSRILRLCPTPGGGEACAVELSCSQDTHLCLQEFICQALFIFFIIIFFFTAIGDNMKCDTAIVHNLM